MGSQDIGELGPKESGPVFVDWKWYYNTYNLAPWAALALAFLLVKANREPRALLILVPLAAANLLLSGLWLLLRQIPQFGSGQELLFSMIFRPLALGMALVWLLGHKLGNRNRFLTLLLAVAVMFAGWFAGALSYGGMQLTAVPSLVYFIVLALTMALGFVLAGWSCRKSWSGRRFVLWLAGWTVVACLVVFLGFMTLTMIFGGRIGRISDFVRTLVSVSVVSLIMGVFVYVIVVPYVILALRSSFFRERFYACLRLKSMAAAAGPAADSGPPDEQDAAPEASENGDSG